jgi:hypothetical protein
MQAALFAYRYLGSYFDLDDADILNRGSSAAMEAEVPQRAPRLGR